MEFDQDITDICPVCHSNQILFYMEKFDDRYGQPDLYDLYNCQKCESIFVRNKVREVDHPALYSKYYTFLPNGSTSENKMIRIENGLLKKIIQKISGEFFLLGMVNDGGSVLEIGPGGISKMRADEILFRHLRWTGLEVNKECVENLQREGLNVYLGKMNELSDRNLKFDAIILSMSIEHLYDPSVFFSACKKILKEDGSIFLTTANLSSRYRKKYGSRWINWHVPYHQVLFSKEGMKYICQSNGFRIRKYQTVTPTSWFMLQRKFNIPERGNKNYSCVLAFQPFRFLLISIFLRMYDFLARESGDCMYCEIKHSS